MKIRRKLALSFLSILLLFLLFALNFPIFFWANRKNTASLENLQKADHRQVLIASIKRETGDLEKQISIMAQMVGGVDAMKLAPEQIEMFEGRVAAIEKVISEYCASCPANNTQATDVANLFRGLADSWRRFHQYLGAQYSAAVMELSLHAEPMSNRLIREILPQLEETERKQAEDAREEFSRVEQITNSTAVIIFAGSIILAVLVAYLFSRSLTRGLESLGHGVARLGQADFDQRIVVSSSHDELGDLASSFNDMASNLHAASKRLTDANNELAERNQEVEKERGISEGLLLNILPKSIAAELRSSGFVVPKYFEDVSVLFSDFKWFTVSTQKLAAEEVVALLQDYFTAFDEIADRYRIEKLKTIGDSYMCVTGLPERRPSHPVDTILAALEIINVVDAFSRKGLLAAWEVRIGIHTGPVIAGIVGIRKFTFDIWGETVNFASRLESSSEPGRINISEWTYNRVKDFFHCEQRGVVATKDKNTVPMYFVNGVLPKLLDDTGLNPPPAFVKRYHAYFQCDPPAFPRYLVAAGRPGPPAASESTESASKEIKFCEKE